MSKSIFQNIPDAEKLLEMRVDELAGFVLEHLHSLSGPSQRHNSHAGNLADQVSSSYHPQYTEKVKLKVREVVGWLRNHHFIFNINEQNFFSFTDEGRKIKTASEFSDNQGREIQQQPSSVIESIPPLSEQVDARIQHSTKASHQGTNNSTESRSPDLSKEARSKLEYPEKATAAWLYHNVSISVWLWFIGIVISAFSIGIVIGQTTFVRELIGKPDQKAASPTPSTKSNGDQTIIPSTNKDYIRERTATELENYLNSLPPLQRDVVFKNSYLGRWVQWEGKITDVSDLENRFIIMLNELNDQSLRGVVSLEVPKHLRSKVEVLRKGDLVRYEGKIKERGYAIHLSDVEQFVVK